MNNPNGTGDDKNPLYVGFPTRGPHVGCGVVKASKFNTGPIPKYPTVTSIILNFSIFLSNFNTGDPPSIQKGLGLS